MILTKVALVGLVVAEQAEDRIHMVMLELAAKGLLVALVAVVLLVVEVAVLVLLAAMAAAALLDQVAMD
jgi:hypothetical protein